MDKQPQQVDLEQKIAELEKLIDSTQTAPFTQKSLSEFEVVFNNSAIGILYLMKDRRIYRANQRLCNIFNYKFEEVIGKTTQFLHLSEESFLNFADQHFPKLSEGKIIKTEYRCRKSSGEILWCSLWGKAISPPELDEGVIWIIDDITERKQLEQLKEDVERMMHHDLKNPLGNIMMLQSLLQHSPNLSEQEKQYVKYIAESGKEIQHLIDIPLDLFKMEIGKYEFHPASVDIISVFKKASIHQQLSTSSSTNRIQIFINGQLAQDDASIYIQAEEHLCYNMFCNLLANAREASQKSDVISIYIQENDRIDITIHNQGAVPEKVRPHFFEKYCTEGKRKGTGLGTYSAKLIAETQGATMSMQTSDENGTKVTVSFPKNSANTL